MEPTAYKTLIASLSTFFAQAAQDDPQKTGGESINAGGIISCGLEYYGGSTEEELRQGHSLREALSSTSVFAGQTEWLARVSVGEQSGNLDAASAREIFGRLALVTPGYASLDYRVLGATGRKLAEEAGDRLCEAGLALLRELWR